MSKLTIVILFYFILFFLVPLFLFSFSERWFLLQYRCNFYGTYCAFLLLCPFRFPRDAGGSLSMRCSFFFFFWSLLLFFLRFIFLIYLFIYLAALFRCCCCCCCIIIKVWKESVDEILLIIDWNTTADLLLVWAVKEEEPQRDAQFTKDFLTMTISLQWQSICI